MSTFISKKEKGACNLSDLGSEIGGRQFKTSLGPDAGGSHP
jgi:hypothetical protein